MNSDSLYEVLGVDSSANEEQIRRAYFEKAKLFHPDSGNGDADKFDTIRRAYVELLNPALRASHDNKLGIRQEFGNSNLKDDYEQRYSGNSGSLQFRASHERGLFKRIISFISSIFKRATNKRDKSNSSSVESLVVEENPNSNNSIERLTLAVYSEDSFPLQNGERLSLAVPKDMQTVHDCISCIKRSFQKYPVIEKAVLIQASLSLLPEESIFLVVLDKKIDQSWGIDTLQSLQIDAYPESLPGLLLCSSASGPFSESVKLYGIEFYPNLISSSIN